MRRLPLLAPMVLIPLLAASASGASPISPWLVPPVAGAIARPFEAPLHRWGPGHRGIDYAVARGTRIASAGPGVVSFAGPVPGGSAVTIEHAGGVATTYSRLGSVEVVTGEPVEEGTILGTVGEAHSGTPGLHLGVLIDGSYVDPTTVLAATTASGAIHLAPLTWRPPPGLGSVFPSTLPGAAGSHRRPCREPGASDVPPRPPNDNVVVAVAGINSSSTGGAAIFRHGPEGLGYPRRRVYRFSYEGVDADDLHAPYERADTLGDIDSSAARLRELLVAVRRRHPHREVDIVAHSMGGIVARDLLARLTRSGDPDMPRIEHLVTFASPHRGAPLAGAIPSLRRDTLTGGFALDALSRWGGRWVPDPRATAVAQLAPDSRLMRSLAREEIGLGIRTLALAIPHDAVVPADRARLAGGPNRVVPPAGWNGHTSVVSSPEARAIAWDFLRDAPVGCKTGWDLWGPRIGSAIGFGESHAGHLYAAAETAALAATPLGGAGAVVGSRLGAWALPSAGRAVAGRVGGWVGRRAAARAGHRVLRSAGKR